MEEKFKPISYFLMLIFGNIIGYYIVSKILSPIYVLLIYLFKGMSPETFHILQSVFIIPNMLFIVFLLFRIYVCFKHKKIVIPTNFTGKLFVTSTIFGLLAFMAILFLIYAMLTLPGGSISGVPLALILLPASFIGFYVTLKCEVPAIKNVYHARRS
jgi:hypothetical protein